MSSEEAKRKQNLKAQLSLPHLAGALLELTKKWMALCQDNVTEWDISLHCADGMVLYPTIGSFPSPLEE